MNKHKSWGVCFYFIYLYYTEEVLFGQLVKFFHFNDKKNLSILQHC